MCAECEKACIESGGILNFQGLNYQRNESSTQGIIEETKVELKHAFAKVLCERKEDYLGSEIEYAKSDGALCAVHWLC